MMRFPVLIGATLGLSAAIAAAQVASHAPTAVAKAAAEAATPQAAGSSLLRPTGKPVARVNGTVLTDRDLMHEMFTIFPYGQLHNGIPKNMEPEMRRGAMDMIVFDELVYQEALRRKLTIPDAQMKAAEQKFLRQFPDRASFDAFMRDECQNSREVFKRKLRRTLLIEALLKLEVGNKAKVSELQAKKYYDENPKKFEHPEMFSIQSISIIPPNASKDVLEEARKRAETALSKAKATKSYQEFGLLAEKYSEDDFRVNMGDHKAVDRAKLPPEIVKAALAMKPGQVSDLIQLGNNYTIFRLNAHISAGEASFNELKDKLRSDLEKSRYDQLRAAFNKRLRKTAKVQEL